MAYIFSTLPKTLYFLQRINFSSLGRGDGGVRVGVKKGLTFSAKAFNNLPEERQIFGLTAPSLSPHF